MRFLPPRHLFKKLNFRTLLSLGIAADSPLIPVVTCFLFLGSFSRNNFSEPFCLARIAMDSLPYYGWRHVFLQESISSEKSKFTEPFCPPEIVTDSHPITVDGVFSFKKQFYKKIIQTVSTLLELRWISFHTTASGAFFSKSQFFQKKTNFPRRSALLKS